MGIIVLGMGITKFTDAYVSSKRTQMEMLGMGATDAVPEAEEELMAEGAPMRSAVTGAGAPGSAPGGIGTSDKAMSGAGGPDGGLAGAGPLEDGQAELSAKDSPELSLAEGAALGQEALDGEPGAEGEAAGAAAARKAAGPGGTGMAGAGGEPAGPGGTGTAGASGESAGPGGTGMAGASGKAAGLDGAGVTSAGGATVGLEGTGGSGNAAPAGGAVTESVLEDASSQDTQDSAGTGEPKLTAADLGLKLEDYQYRFSELDDQIQRMRSAETENTVQSVRSAVKTELRIWERELEAVYSLLIVSLDEEAAEDLRTDQQTWIIERDAAAQEVSKKNSGSIESVEYTASIAASTRERAYQLVERYR